MPATTAAERLELAKLVRLNARVAKDDVQARGQWLLADAEAKLAAVFQADDAAWADVTAAAEKHVAEADAVLAALCRERGIPEEFRPSLHLSWYGRGENAMATRRAELRKVAQRQVEALVKQAQVEIARQEAAQLTEITKAGVTSSEARAFLGSMPKPEELLPPLQALKLPTGQVVALASPGEAVTASRNDPVTARRSQCAFCGRTFTPARRDSKYCQTACRVADHRRRQAARD
jgi:hypothetical protein